MNTLFLLLVTSLVINLILILRLMLAEQDRKQANKILGNTMIEKERLRQIIKSTRQN